MKKRGGFTLFELLVVMLIIAVLMSLGSRALSKAQLRAKKTQATVELKSIETAIKAYKNRYGKLPVDNALLGGADVGGDAESSREIIEVLTAQNTTLNPAEIIFLEPQSHEDFGAFFDPWGEQYLLVLDTNYDGSVVIEDQEVRRELALVSIGLQEARGSSDAADLVTSWD